jgi:hypothetical protein
MFEAFTLEEVKARLAADNDEFWFVSYFEITIEDLIEAFGEKVAERLDEVALEMGYVKKVQDYDDR